MCIIFTFLKQSFNDSLDFCNRSYPHELHRFDWQLPSSLARAIRPEHRTYLPEVILVLRLTASHTRVARAKQASCFLHWLSVFGIILKLTWRSSGFTYFARDPKYSSFHEHSKNWIHVLHVSIAIFRSLAPFLNLNPRVTGNLNKLH